MAAADQIQILKSDASGAGFLDMLRNKWSRYRVYRATFNELSELSGRDLADLGLNRSNLRAAAYQAAYGDH